jgi:selenocysteine lyase/cysteine desulfurase
MNRREWLAGASATLAATTSGGMLASPQTGGAPASPRASAALASRSDFPLTQTRTYLNNAAFHPLSVHASRAAQDYLTRRTEGTKEPDWDASARVKKAFAGLINAKTESVCYVQSTMAGENLALASLGFRPGTGNVVTDALHFEGSLYLFGSLAEQGADVRIVKPRDWRIDMGNLERAIDRNTKLVAISLVSFLNGFEHDLKAVCDLAHAHGAYVYADIIQAAGAVPIDVEATGVDFCACASYKWLMGDFGLGFFYAREDLLGRVVPRVQYGWRQLAHFEYHLLPHDAPGSFPASWKTVPGAPGHFELGTFSRTAEACLTHSLGHIQQIGVERIQAHAQALTQRLQRELPRLGFAPLTPSECRSPIVTFVVKDPEATKERLKQANVDVKTDQHYMRVSPSIYNDQGDVDRLLDALS